MNRSDLQQLAQQYFISDAGLSVANLVRKIQLAEGHVDCFSTGKTDCDEMRCRWRSGCLAGPLDTAGPGIGEAMKLESRAGGAGND